MKITSSWVQLAVKLKRWGSLIVVVLTLATGTAWMLKSFNETQEKSTIHIFHPYRVIFPLNPQKIYSVGDQVIAEHLFGFHSKQNLKNGFKSVLSEITFDQNSNKITVQPNFDIFTSNGTKIVLEEIAEKLKENLSGSNHIPSGIKVISTIIEKNKFVLTLNRLPNNIEFLFTLPDLAINNQINKNEANLNTTGPYYFKSATEDEVHLVRNPFYPEKLVANKINNVTYHSYIPGKNIDDVNQFIDKMDPNEHHLVYFFGHSTTFNNIEKLKLKNYNIRIFPSEWFTYLTFANRVSDVERLAFSALVHSFKDKYYKNLQTPHQKSYSIAPLDRPFGLTQTEYQTELMKTQDGSNLLKKEEDAINVLKNISNKRKIVLSTIEKWKELPVFREFTHYIQEKIPNATFETLADFPTGLEQPSNETFDVFFTMIGMSPADPLSYLSFLIKVEPNFSKILTEKKLTELSKISDAEEFSNAIKEIEKEIIRKQYLIPIAHFPGIVAEAPGFERDENLAWSWGTQAWTYRVR